MFVIVHVVSFSECISMLESNLMCESYEYFNEGILATSQTTSNDFASA